MATVTISLPDSLKAFVETQLETGGYGNVSEYFRSLLREAQAKEQAARLEARLLEGLAAQSLPLDDRFRRALADKVERILERDGRRRDRRSPESRSQAKS